MMGFPAVIAAYQAIVVSFCFKYDSPVYYLQTGDSVKYKAVLSSIFNEEDVQIEIDTLRKKQDNDKEYTTIS